MIKVKYKGISYECETALEAIRLLKWLTVNKTVDARIRSYKTKKAKRRVSK